MMLVAVLGGALSLGGCSMPKTVSGWFGGEPAPSDESAGDKAQVYYASAAGVKVYSKPTASSTVVGELALHEKVTRYKVERGYAYVRAQRSGVTGWVNNAMLVWRVSAAPSAAEPEPTAKEPEVEEPGAAPEIPATPTTAPQPSPPPSDTPATERKPTPSKPAPSLFDPY